MYIRHYIGELFPVIPRLYKRLTGKQFDPYEGNQLIGARFRYPEGESMLKGARFRVNIKSLEELTEISKL